MNARTLHIFSYILFHVIFQREFLIKWTGYPNASWEPERNILDSALITDYFKDLENEKMVIHLIENVKFMFHAQYVSFAENWKWRQETVSCRSSISVGQFQANQFTNKILYN